MSELSSVVNRTAIITTQLNFHGFLREPVSVPTSHDIVHWKIDGKHFEECRDEEGEIEKWCAESFSKNSVAEVVELAHPEDDDWVIFSDADEIPDREFVRLLHECELPVVGGNVTGGSDIIFLRLQSWAHYLYNFRCQAQQSLWTHGLRGPVVMKARTMRKLGLYHFQARGTKDCHAKGAYASCWPDTEWRTKNMLLLPCSSWHLSHFGGSMAIMRTTLDNSDNAQLQDFENVRGCQERNLGRNDPYNVLEQAKRAYPAVPHSVADSAASYRVFMDF